MAIKTCQERGTALVETVIIIPTIFLMIFAVIDIGRALHMYLGLTRVVYESVRIGGTLSQLKVAPVKDDSWITRAVTDERLCGKGTCANLSDEILYMTAINRISSLLQNTYGPDPSAETLEPRLRSIFQWQSDLVNRVELYPLIRVSITGQFKPLISLGLGGWSRYTTFPISVTAAGPFLTL